VPPWRLGKPTDMTVDTLADQWPTAGPGNPWGPLWFLEV
jgi:hypothetical protein